MHPKADKARQILDYVEANDLDPENAALLTREALRDLCRYDLYFLCVEILDFGDLEKPFHDDLCNFLNGPGNNKLVLLSRGHLKSSIGTVGYGVQRILRDPNIRILISNATEENAVDFAGQIQVQFRENTKLIDLFPEYQIKQKRFTPKHFVCPARTKTSMKEDTVESVGVGTNIVSRHYDLLIKDDLVNLRCMESAADNDRVKRWHAASKPLLDPPPSWFKDTTELVIGTRWHTNDLYSELISQNSYDTMICGLKNDDGEYHFSRFSQKIEDSIMSDMQALPGGMFLFYSQYYNVARNPENAMFREDHFIEVSRDAIREKLPALRKYLLVDPATSNQYYSDPAGMIVLGVDEDSRWYILEIHNNKTEPEKLVKQVYKISEAHKQTGNPIYRIIFEERGLQKTYTYALRLYGEANNLKLPSMIPAKVGGNMTKENRIDGLQPLFEQGHVVFVKGIPNLAELKMQLLNHRNGPKHDDLMDALSFALGYVKSPLEGMREIVSEEDPVMSMDYIRKIQQIASQGGGRVQKDTPEFTPARIRWGA